MPKTPTPKPEAQETTPAAESAENASANPLALIQRTMDDLTARIADHPKTSFAVRLARAYRAGAPPDSLNGAVAIIEAAVADAKAALEYAATAPTTKAKAEPVVVPSRASLQG